MSLITHLETPAQHPCSVRPRPHEDDTVRSVLICMAMFVNVLDLTVVHDADNVIAMYNGWETDYDRLGRVPVVPLKEITCRVQRVLATSPVIIGNFQAFV